MTPPSRSLQRRLAAQQGKRPPRFVAGSDEPLKEPLSEADALSAMVSVVIDAPLREVAVEYAKTRVIIETRHIENLRALAERLGFLDELKALAIDVYPIKVRAREDEVLDLELRPAKPCKGCERHASSHDSWCSCACHRANPERIE